ncbi:synaptonemal complex protein 1-like isoform X2 [Rosa rugosa]|uniref:synaptonemal complex protein 1-like isoform X2 n=1 Tax=Rosa rugosa TaxID=74645 RepID=UPI002B417192|nr:synaptonemal complex protein 1-like isoform X2 [Rosa rugosa]
MANVDASLRWRKKHWVVDAVKTDLEMAKKSLEEKMQEKRKLIRNREKELEECRLEKEEHHRNANLLDEKDAMINNFEETLANNRLATGSLNTKLGDVLLELKIRLLKIKPELKDKALTVSSYLALVPASSQATFPYLFAVSKYLQVSSVQQKHDKKERCLKAKHSEELKQIQLQAENELREKMTSMRNEHETRLRALGLQHEDEINKLQKDLYLQKSKEEKQRALLQLQWKVMSDEPEEEQEVNLKKEYSISSRRNPVIRRRGQHSLRRPEHEKDSPLVGATQTPVSTLLKKASENMNSPTVMNISKHHKKVIRDGYEIETGNGRTIKRKSRSTVMFVDPRKHKRTSTSKVKSPKSVVKGSKGEGQPCPSNIGDLFSEGSLNPYAGDPYAFDQGQERNLYGTS